MTDQDHLSAAEADIVRVGEITSALDQAVWDLQSAVSLFDKAASGSYRASRKTGDAPWDAAEHMADVTEARSALNRAIVVAHNALGNLRPFESIWPGPIDNGRGS